MPKGDVPVEVLVITRGSEVFFMPQSRVVRLIDSCCAAWQRLPTPFAKNCATTLSRAVNPCVDAH